MGIGNFDNGDKRKDAIVLSCFIFIILFIVWFVASPGDSFAQFSLLGNNIQRYYAKNVKKEDVDEWKFHRNNAICYAKMENKNGAFVELELAKRTITTSESDYEYYKLYKESAMIKLYFKDYKGALDDYLMLPDLNISDKLKVAMLFKKSGNYVAAATYCNEILSADVNAYAGYACLADIYANVNKYKSSVKIYDLLIARTTENPLYYKERAEYKKLSGDFQGYEEDLAKSKTLNNIVELDYNLLENVINPKALELSI